MKKKRVFIVHGRDKSLRDEVKAYLSECGWSPVILAEQTSSGRTIIEKIENYADVQCAVVLYSGCDWGALKGEAAFSPRARQNVVLEHGFFIGRLGRERVFAIKENGVEVPNDLAGVVYIEKEGDWKRELRKELSALPAQKRTAAKKNPARLSLSLMPSVKELSTILGGKEWSICAEKLECALRDFIDNIDALVRDRGMKAALDGQDSAWDSQHRARRLYYQLKTVLNSESLLSTQANSALLLLYASAIASGKKRGYAALERLVKRKYRTDENGLMFDAWVAFLHSLPPEGEMNNNSIYSFAESMQSCLADLLIGEGKLLPADFPSANLFCLPCVW